MISLPRGAEIPQPMIGTSPLGVHLEMPAMATACILPGDAAAAVVDTHLRLRQVDELVPPLVLQEDDLLLGVPHHLAHVLRGLLGRISAPRVAGVERTEQIDRREAVKERRKV